MKAYGKLNNNSICADAADSLQISADVADIMRTSEWRPIQVCIILCLKSAKKSFNKNYASYNNE